MVYGVVVGLDDVKRHALANEPGGRAAPVAARLGCSCAAEHLGEVRGGLLALLPVVGGVVGVGGAWACVYYLADQDRAMIRETLDALRGGEPNPAACYAEIVGFVEARNGGAVEIDL